jgi:hypothetical protein
MAASISFYNNWREAINDAALRAATVKVTLHNSTYTFAATHSVYADLTNELSTANGYTNGGYTITPSWDHSGATATFDASDATWTASGGSIVWRRAVIRVVGTFNGQVDPLICSILGDTTPADITTTDTNVLTIQWNASGIFTIT